MDKLFILQLVVSFLVGGSFIAFLSFAAEKAGKKTAGLILTFPSTVAIALFFIGWANGSVVAAKIIPSTFVPFAGVFLYLMVYVYFAKYIASFRISKFSQIAISSVVSSLAWLLLSIPTAIIEPTNLFLTLPIYIAFFFIAFYFLSKKPRLGDEAVSIRYTLAQKFYRALFSGFIISLAVFLSKALTPFWGGIFTSYPAAFSSSLMILHWYHKPEFLFHITKNAPVGSFTSAVYMLSAMILFPIVGIIYGTIGAYLASLAFFYILGGFRGKMGDIKYQYTTKDAEAYESLGIKNTTYEIGFDEVQKLLGDIQGKIFLDFGCGTGRSSEFLKVVGAKKVFGIDHDNSMIGQAKKKELEGIEFIKTDKTIPLPDNSIDGAISANVFIEIRSLEKMKSVCFEIARVLKPGGVFVVMSTNPQGFGHDFKNWKHIVPDNIKSGDIVICTVKSKEKTFTIEDTYWEESDYRSALESTGFRIEKISYPKAKDKSAWETEEVSVAPFIVIKSVLA